MMTDHVEGVLPGLREGSVVANMAVPGEHVGQVSGEVSQTQNRTKKQRFEI